MPKRRRVDDGADASEQPDGVPVTPLKRSEEVWFDDGNVILQTRDMQFKVHRGVLAKHSPIFSDLFQIPQPPSEPTVDGCPVVELQDSPVDVKYVLKALYGLGDYLNSDVSLHISVVTAMIRIGRKYEIPHLNAEGMRRLKREYPTTLEENDDLDHRAYTHIDTFELAQDESGENETGGETEDETNVSEDFSVVLGIIKLAHECHIQSILPALYLQTTRFALENLLHPHAQLPPKALRSCICGRDKLLNVWRDRTHVIGQSEKCLSKAECKRGATSLLEGLKQPAADLASLLLPWDTFAEIWEDSLESLCVECIREAKEVHDKEREATWTSLPEYFKLRSWDDLKDV